MIPFFEKTMANLTDAAMCGFLNVGQFRHQIPHDSRWALEEYIAECASLTPETFFALPVEEETDVEEELQDLTREHPLTWRAPVTTAFPENNRAYADLFPCAQGWSAPTVIMLHAFMSASDIGYRRAALRFNALGWNAAFIHLPYHYSRRPKGYLNGELAITADLVRTSQGLRQGVIELRQLMRRLRSRGCREFGLWATSYGGWIGALLSSVERDFRFIALMAPIVDVEHAIWESRAAIQLRSQLKGRGISHDLVEQHFHLTSPMHNIPLAGSDKVVFAAGRYDLVAKREDIWLAHERWEGSAFIEVAQGHFGYRMMPATFEHLKEQGVFEIPHPASK